MIAPVESHGHFIQLFLFRPPQSLKTGSLSLSRVRRSCGHPCFQGGHTGRTRLAASSASPRCCPLCQSLTQPLTGGNDWRSSRVPGGSILTLCVLFQGPSLFFTAAQFLRGPPLQILTQNVTQNIESRRGAYRNDLRVLGDFRPKKARKALGRSGLRTGIPLITRRSEVQVLSPQP